MLSSGASSPRASRRAPVDGLLPGAVYASAMARPVAHLFILGRDYHLGDLLWFTAVLAAYREQVRPERVFVACPDRPISRILERHTLIDELVLYGESCPVPDAVRAHAATVRRLVVHDLRPLPIAVAMVRRWRERTPWLYVRDLWLEERGQWLATFLHLGRLQRVRPVLRLAEDDRAEARKLRAPYALLAPHTGRYRLPLLGRMWRGIKGWDEANWVAVADALREQGYEPITLAAAGEAPIPGTRAAIGLPIRQVAGVIERASILISVESGLWYAAAALGCPFVIVPWWLPGGIDWTASLATPHRLIRRERASVALVLSQARALLAPED